MKKSFERVNSCFSFSSKKGVSFVLFILSISLASAYIDPGTGGYLASSLGNYVLTSLAIFFAAVGAFLSKHFIIPLKKFFKKMKGKLASITLAIFPRRHPSIAGAGKKVKNNSSKLSNKNKKFQYFLAGLIVLFLAGFIYLQISESNILNGTSQVVFDKSLSGAHFYDAGKVYPGYIYYSGKLIDMSGTVVKNWSSVYLGVLDSDGDYYAQKCYECDTWGKYTWDDKVIWEKKIPIHHEILLTNDSVFTFTKETHLYHGRKVEFDGILEFDKNGTFKMVDMGTFERDTEVSQAFRIR